MFQQLTMGSRNSSQSMVFIVALILLVNLDHLGGTTWCSANAVLSPSITVSLNGPLTAVRSRRPINGLSTRTKFNHLEQLLDNLPDLSANNVSGNNQLTPDRTATTSIVRPVTFDAPKQSLVRGLARRASSVGNFFKQKIQNTYGSAQDLCDRRVGEIKERLEANYLTVLIRFSKWYSQYKKLYEANKGSLMKPLDLVKQEYAKVDKEIYDDEVVRLQLLAGKTSSLPDLKQIESMDYLFKVLVGVINELEIDLDQRLRQMNGDFTSPLNRSTSDASDISGSLPKDVNDKSSDAQQSVNNDIGEFRDGPDHIDETKDPHEALLDELEQRKQLEKAFNRAQKIIGKATASLVINELAIIAQIAFLDSLATFVMTQPDNPLIFLTPIVRFIGNVQTPLLTSYLRNIQIRATFKLIGLCNPVPGALGKMFKLKENR